MIIADSDVLIDALVGKQPAMAKVAELILAGQLQTTAITSFEILSGAGVNRRGNEARKLIAGLEVIPRDRRAAEIGANVRRELTLTGTTIGTADSMIAGIALLHDLPILTSNVKHFSRVPNIRIIPVGKS